MVLSREELEAIGQDYSMSLEELTFNSRPIISNLTTIAQENIQAAAVITRAIEEHISKCGPSSKLPGLYLLDSICKNVGSPYTLLFGRNLYRTFTDAYTLVNDEVRRKMHELFQTWVQPISDTGQSLFANEPLKKIEYFLSKARSAILEMQQHDQARYGNTYRQQTPSLQHASASTLVDPKLSASRTNGGYLGHNALRPSGQPTIHSSTPTYHSPLAVNEPAHSQHILPISAMAPTLLVSKESLLNKISGLIQVVNERLRDNPSDAMETERFLALSNLHSILMTSELPPSDLAAIKERLDTLSVDLQRYGAKRKAENDIFNDTKRPWNTQDNATTNIASILPQALSQSGIPSLGQPNLAQATPINLSPDLLSSMIQSISQYSAPAQPQSGDTSSTASALFASLMSAGMIPTMSGQPNLAQIQTGNSKEAFAKLVIAEVEISNAFLQKRHPNLVTLLYDSLPLQCSTCGRRFGDSARDQQLRAAHLDWHFRVNKRLREDARGQSRSWYLDEEAWINYSDDIDDTTVTTEENKDGNENSKEALKEDVSGRYIPVPKDTTSASSPCPICKEKFKSVWHDKTEDWVWMNAVKAENGKIYHATCLQDTGTL